jgi:hypothetical protein
MRATSCTCSWPDSFTITNCNRNFVPIIPWFASTLGVVVDTDSGIARAYKKPPPRILVLSESLADTTARPLAIILKELRGGTSELQEGCASLAP